MMSDKAASYFTIGEFAQLFGISKQTLFYYEKNNIFSPELIEANGYRYYSLEQYFIFEIIITLRKLGVSLKEIGEYVKNRNIDSLENLLSYKALEYDIQLELLQRNKSNLLIKIEQLKQVKALHNNCITLEPCAEEYFVADTLPAKPCSTKEQINRIAAHNLPFAASEILNEYPMGYIVLQQDLSNPHPPISCIFTRVSHPDEYVQVQVKPHGLYVKLITADGYHSQYAKALQKMLAFIHRNDLKVKGDAYINQLRNYWATSDPAEYITQIEIPVTYKNS